MLRGKRNELVTAGKVSRMKTLYKAVGVVLIILEAVLRNFVLVLFRLVLWIAIAVRLPSWVAMPLFVTVLLRPAMKVLATAFDADLLEVAALGGDLILFVVAWMAIHRLEGGWLSATASVGVLGGFILYHDYL